MTSRSGVRSRRSTMGSAALILAACALLVPAPAAAQVTIRMAAMMPANSAWALVLKEMAADWSKVSGGKVTLRLYLGATRGDDQNVVGDMRTGALDAAVLTSAGVAEIDRSVYAVSIPMAYDSYEEVYAVLDKIRPKLEASLEKQGFIALNWMDAGWIHFFTKKPVAVPDDLRKLVLFQWQGDPKSMAIWQAAGFNPRADPASELLSGLKKGTYQALSAPSQVALIMRYYEDAAYMTDLNWAVLLGATVVRRESWNAIPKDIRPALLKSAQAAGDKLRADVRKNGDASVAAMKQGHLTVVPVDAKARDAWLKTAAAVYPKVRGGYVPAEAFDEALKYRDEYRKLLAAPGAPTK
jgi:TRAP-type C4-dicarboxylate transport system substrate-binding protein